MKKVIVLSGINLFSGGTLAIYKDILHSLVENKYDKKFKIIAFVYKKALFDDISGEIEYIEKPLSRKSYFFRLWYEFIYFYWFSMKRNIFIWISMHDITPNVKAEFRYVYCHNPSMFYKFKLQDFYFAPKMVLFSLFYKYLYRINIKKNQAVIVQSEWLRKKFRAIYDLDKVIVAYPRIQNREIPCTRSKDKNYLFLYPALPRVFKNFEIICEACRIINKLTNYNYKVVFTIDGMENNYSRYLKRKYGQIREIVWLGLQTREATFELYGEADCLIFPSKLETWGLPISEFENTGKVMLLADLEYAHETAGFYEKKVFFDPFDSMALAREMVKCMQNRTNYAPDAVQKPEHFTAASWDRLFFMLGIDEA